MPDKCPASANNAPIHRCYNFQYPDKQSLPAGFSWFASFVKHDDSSFDAENNDIFENHSMKINLWTVISYGKKFVTNLN